ncbi:MAG: FFLEELY motif protein [Candidatus Bathyanammoxibius sp.]
MTVNGEAQVGLRRYQASMLKATYRDLMADEGYNRLIIFLLDTIYNSEDANAPADTFAKVYDYFMERPNGKPIAILTKLVELNRLTEGLDRSLAEEIGKTSEITDAVYVAALHACNNRKERTRHIELFIKCITKLHRLSRHPLNAFIFKVMKLLMSYLGRPKGIKIVEEGYKALLGTEDLSRLTGTIRELELARLERAYGAA